jgi:hypothetical protein
MAFRSAWKPRRRIDRKRGWGSLAVFETQSRSVADRDGKGAEAIRVIQDCPELSVRSLVEKLKEMGIKRGRTWVGEKLSEVKKTGVLLS